MTKAFYSDSILPQIKELLSNGHTPNQLAAALHISSKDLQSWLDDPDTKFDSLRREMEVGLTAGQAFWEREAQLAILGHRKFFKESTFKLYMENLYKWKEHKSEDGTVKSEEQLLPDQVLQEQLKELLNRENGQSRITETSSGTGSSNKSE